VTCCDKDYKSSEKGETVMKKLLSILALLMAASMLIWLAGCGGDDDDDDCADNVAPSVQSVVPNGGDIALNTTITVTLSKAVETISITLGGAAITPNTTDNRVYTFTPTAEGNGQALAITAEDACGDALDPAYGGATFNVAPLDTTAPTILGNQCVPKNGDTGVDPADVTEEIIIKFSEAMKKVSVDSFEPSGATIDDSLSGDTLTISFLGGYSLGNEEEVSVELSGEDLAGNALGDGSYGFTTMAKEE
jgi:hypothetical protein